MGCLQFVVVCIEGRNVGLKEKKISKRFDECFVSKVTHFETFACTDSLDKFLEFATLIDRC